MRKRLVIALGGNALGNTPIEQLRLVEKTADTIVDLVQDGYDVIIGHGNGPQVGMVNLAFENSHNLTDSTPVMPFPECGAMTQGYIGYHLQQSIGKKLKERNIDRDVATVITQVEVDKDDPAFNNPTKPIGSFYSKQDADTIAHETGYTFVEDAGRGYRRVVASPTPVSIVEIGVVDKLVKQGVIVITVGGGGIPVVKNKDYYEGVDAVIDKDRASSKLAIDLNADMLVILTAVEKVAINFNTPEQKNLDKLSIEEAKQYIEQKHFAPGSMLPKIEACLDFVEKTSGKAIITSLEKASEGIKGNTGTLIYNKED